VNLLAALAQTKLEPRKDLNPSQNIPGAAAREESYARREANNTSTQGKSHLQIKDEKLDPAGHGVCRKPLALGYILEAQRLRHLEAENGVR